MKINNEVVKNTNKKKTIRVKNSVILVAICLSIIIGFLIGTISTSGTILDSSVSGSVLGEALKIIEEEWIDTTGSVESIEHQALIGMMNELGDPYSEYWTPEMAIEFNKQVSGNVEGIGIGYQLIYQGAMVVTVYQNTPAELAGIQVGDILIKVDGESLSGLTSDEIKTLVTGEPGSDITIDYTRDGVPHTVSTKRDSLDISAQVEIREEDGKKFGYILLTTFGTNTGQEVAKALEMFTEERIETLVFDFRNNGGGYLSAAREIGNLFVPEGVPIYKMQGKSGPAQETLATNGVKYVFENSFILINGQTASASELVAATLSEVCNFTLIGEKTYGKGTAQTQRELSDGSVLKFTYAKWLSSKGTFIGETGLIPHIEVNNVDVSRVSSAEVSQPLAYDQVSSHIISLQNMLNIMGYDVDRKDGYFSKQTENALVQFEKDYGLTADGIYDNSDHLYMIARLMIFIDQVENDYQYHKLLDLLR